jgi:HNH endonuclease
MAQRQAIPQSLRIQVLTEAGYRCAVPTCRNILALDLHHIEEVAEGGTNELGNLIALCPMCHALYTRGIIPRESIYAWKLMLVSLSHAFDTNTIDDLLFLKTPDIQSLRVSGDGVLKFSRLIAAGLASFRLTMQNGPLIIYEIGLTEKGERLVDAWMSGNRNAVATAFGEEGT